MRSLSRVYSSRNSSPSTAEGRLVAEITGDSMEVTMRTVPGGTRWHCVVVAQLERVENHHVRFVQPLLVSCRFQHQTRVDAVRGTGR